MDEQKNPQNIVVRTTTFTGSQYAQIVGVTITDNEITLEFVYKNPRQEIKEAQVVSRVTMPRQAALGLAETIYKTNQAHAKKEKGKNE